MNRNVGRNDVEMNMERFRGLVDDQVLRNMNLQEVDEARDEIADYVDDIEELLEGENDEDLRDYYERIIEELIGILQPLTRRRIQLAPHRRRAVREHIDDILGRGIRSSRIAPAPEPEVQPLTVEAVERFGVENPLVRWGGFGSEDGSLIATEGSRSYMDVVPDDVSNSLSTFSFGRTSDATSSIPSVEKSSIRSVSTRSTPSIASTYSTPSLIESFPPDSDSNSDRGNLAYRMLMRGGGKMKFDNGIYY